MFINQENNSTILCHAWDEKKQGILEVADLLFSISKEGFNYFQNC